MSDNTKVMMNRGEDYATVHGERAHGDKHAVVHFYQKGLPFDSEGVLIEDHSEIKNDQKKKAQVEKLKERARKQAQRDAARAEGGDAEDDDGEGEQVYDPLNPAAVDLVKWAQGEKYPWQDVTNKVSDVTGRRVGSKKDAIILLVEEGKVQRSQVTAPDLKQYLG